jgi:hypothetical protein
MTEENLYKELGFVTNCHMSGAISFNELIEWIFLQIKREDNLPTFIYSLPDAKDFSELRHIMGRTIKLKLINSLTKLEEEALLGIAFKRRLYTIQELNQLCTKKTALKNLEKNPNVLTRFRETFPFIKLEWLEP